MSTHTESRPLDQGELYDLSQKLDKITTDLVDRLWILATDPWARNGISGPYVQSQPASRPPYNLAAGVTANMLCNEIDTTVRHICEHRGISYPDAVTTAVAGAVWLRKHVVAIQVMPDGREISEHLHRVIDQAVRTVGFDEQEYRIPKAREEAMTREANRIDVDAAAVARLARTLGDQAKGLNRDRVDYLRRKGFLAGEQIDGKWWYKLGDVLAAHKRAREARGKVSA